MKRLLSTLLLTTILSIVYGQNRTVSAKEFTDSIDSIGLKFIMPDNYEESAVIQNKDLFYSFAMKRKNTEFEVRYSIWSMKPQLIKYEKCKATPGCSMVHPNRMFESIAQVNILNMTGGKWAELGAFPKNAVKSEFNADTGGSSFFEFNCAFGKGYKYGQMVVLHKDNIADIIITFMSNDKAKHGDLMFESFHSLTFK